MSRQGVLEPAYVLHSRDYRDTSLIIDALTRESGRFSMVVRGARSGKSRLRGRLQPFTPLLVACLGRTELRTATTIDFPARPYRIRGQNLMLGLYVNELLYRLLGRFDPVPGIYAAYESMLAELQGFESAVSAVRQFELNLLAQLGYGISFAYDAGNGEPVSADRRYRFMVHEGFRATGSQEADTFTGDELMHIAGGELRRVSDRKLKSVTRASLAILLGDKPLKSRSLFRGTGQ